MSGLPVVRVIVSIDTEEDNWLPVQRGITTRNIDAMPSLERRFEALGVRATYFTNYAVTQQPSAAAIMRDIHLAGRSEIAAHLHPWNTPPLLDGAETMLFKLPLAAQSAKLASVTESLAELRGTRPRAFRAGRFALGSSTVCALIEAGYAIDSSVTPFISWEQYDNGPSFMGAPLHIYRLGGNGDVRVPDDGPLVEVPLSSGYHRWQPACWPGIQTWLTGSIGRRLQLARVASRLDFARATLLSPEVFTIREMHSLARALIRGGLQFLHIFWHSPSMTPGLNEFCRTGADVERLMAKFERLLDLLERHASLRFVTISEAVAEIPITPSPRAGA